VRAGRRLIRRARRRGRGRRAQHVQRGAAGARVPEAARAVEAGGDQRVGHRAAEVHERDRRLMAQQHRDRPAQAPRLRVAAPRSAAPWPPGRGARAGRRPPRERPARGSLANPAGPPQRACRSQQRMVQSLEDDAATASSQDSTTSVISPVCPRQVVSSSIVSTLQNWRARRRGPPQPPAVGEAGTGTESSARLLVLQLHMGLSKAGAQQAVASAQARRPGMRCGSCARAGGHAAGPHAGCRSQGRPAARGATARAVLRARWTAGAPADLRGRAPERGRGHACSGPRQAPPPASQVRPPNPRHQS